LGEGLAGVEVVGRSRACAIVLVSLGAVPELGVPLGCPGRLGALEGLGRWQGGWITRPVRAIATIATL